MALRCSFSFRTRSSCVFLDTTLDFVRADDTANWIFITVQRSKTAFDVARKSIVVELSQLTETTEGTVDRTAAKNTGKTAKTEWIFREFIVKYKMVAEWTTAEFTKEMTTEQIGTEFVIN